MNIIVIVLVLILLNPLNVSANIVCNDGTVSPSCGDCHQGCCSHHGGCLSSYNSSNSSTHENNNSEKNDGEHHEETKDGFLYLLGIGTFLIGGYYIGKKRCD